MELDLADHHDRMTYFYGYYHELGVQLVLGASVQPGDTFVDVGANAGMITLLAARLVGPEGRVVAFEPNPLAMARLRSSIAANNLLWVTPFEMGLSDAPGRLTLRVPSGWDSTCGTFGHVAPADGPIGIQEHKASVARGDDILFEIVSAPLAVKIDVEGFEQKVVNGLEATISQFSPLIITEVLAENLTRAGSTVKPLFDTMARLGYFPFGIELSVLLRSRKLHLRPVRPVHEDPPENVVWLHPGSAHYERLQPWIRPS